LFEDFHYNIYGFMKSSHRGGNALEILKNWKPKIFEAELATMSEEDLMHHLIEQKLMIPARFNYDFLKPIIGVDLGTVPFDHEKSRQFISLTFADGKKINVIGLRFEDISKWPTVLREYWPMFPEEMIELQKHEEELLVTRYQGLKEYLDKTGYFTSQSLDELRSYPNQNYYSDCEVEALAHLANVTDLSRLPPADSKACSPDPTPAPTPYAMDKMKKECATPAPTETSNETTSPTTQNETLSPTTENETWSPTTEGETLSPTTEDETMSPTADEEATPAPTETPTTAPTLSPTSAPTEGSWNTITGCFDKERPWVRVDDMYCPNTVAPTPSPTTLRPTPTPTVQGHWVVTILCRGEDDETIDTINCPEIQDDAILESY
jgi:hypothetical protein